MQVNNNNFLNASQVSQIRNSLIGTNETQMPSVFNSVKHLDSNNNKTIEQNEVSNNDILSLGKDVLTKIANFFGISIDNDTNSSSGDINGENKDQIVENYAKPFSQISTEEMTELSKNEKIILSKEEIEHYYNAIIEDKLASGVEITKKEKDQKGTETITFSDGSFVQFIKTDSTETTTLFYSGDNEYGDGGSAFEMNSDDKFMHIFSSVKKPLNDNDDFEYAYDINSETITVSVESGDSYKGVWVDKTSVLQEGDLNDTNKIRHYVTRDIISYNSENV